MKYGAVVSARMTSSRLPGKSMMDLEGKPLIERVVERIKKSQLVSGIVIATTTNIKDDPIASLAVKLGLAVYRGSEEDVLQRVLLAAEQNNIEIIVRVTGDCPLVDPKIIDRTIRKYEEEKADYTCNDSHIPSLFKPSYPRGLDVEVFSTKLLDEISRLTNDRFHREHVTLYIYENKDKYKISAITAEPDENCPELRLCVDTQEDLDFVREVYRNLSSKNPNFLAKDIVALVKKRPELARMNINARQKSPREK